MLKQSRCSGLWLCDIERMLQIFGRSSRLVGRNVQDAAGNPSTYQSRKPMAIAGLRKQEQQRDRTVVGALEPVHEQHHRLLAREL